MEDITSHNRLTKFNVKLPKSNINDSKMSGSPTSDHENDDNHGNHGNHGNRGYTSRNSIPMSQIAQKLKDYLAIKSMQHIQENGGIHNFGIDYIFIDICDAIIYSFVELYLKYVSNSSEYTINIHGLTRDRLTNMFDRKYFTIWSNVVSANEAAAAAAKEKNQNKNNNNKNDNDESSGHGRNRGGSFTSKNSKNSKNSKIGKSVKNRQSRQNSRNKQSRQHSKNSKNSKNSTRGRNDSLSHQSQLSRGSYEAKEQLEQYSVTVKVWDRIKYANSREVSLNTARLSATGPRVGKDSMSQAQHLKNLQNLQSSHKVHQLQNSQSWQGFSSQLETIVMNSEQGVVRGSIDDIVFTDNEAEGESDRKAQGQGEGEGEGEGEEEQGQIDLVVNSEEHNNNGYESAHLDDCNSNDNINNSNNSNNISPRGRNGASCSITNADSGDYTVQEDFITDHLGKTKLDEQKSGSSIDIIDHESKNLNQMTSNVVSNEVSNQVSNPEAELNQFMQSDEKDKDKENDKDNDNENNTDNGQGNNNNDDDKDTDVIGKIESEQEEKGKKVGFKRKKSKQNKNSKISKNNKNKNGMIFDDPKLREEKKEEIDIVNHTCIKAKLIKYAEFVTTSHVNTSMVININAANINTNNTNNTNNSNTSGNETRNGARNNLATILARTGSSGTIMSGVNIINENDNINYSLNFNVSQENVVSGYNAYSLNEIEREVLKWLLIELIESMEGAVREISSLMADSYLRFTRNAQLYQKTVKVALKKIHEPSPISIKLTRTLSFSHKVSN